MKERVIRIGVLVIVFILALTGFSLYLNRGNAKMTADMGAATLPTVSFEAEGYEMNLLAGYVQEMDVPAMRDTITPLSEDGSVTLQIQPHDRSVTSLTYTVYGSDGKEKLLVKQEKEVAESVTVRVGDILAENQEGILQLQLHFDEGKSAYYYTRVIKPQNAQFAGCMEFIKTLHTNMLENTETDEVKKVMEPNGQGDNTTLQHVTIHSDMDHVTWGELHPEVVGEVCARVQKVKEAYTSVQLRYRVKCVGEHDAEELYRVKEFFKVRCVDGKYYLLAYDRTMEEVFDGSNGVLTSKGITLGVTGQDVQYKVNQEGTIVAFVQADELWSYHKEENEFALIFGFSDSEKDDIRNHFDEHSVRILSMEENGNLTFAVYGYMNRGRHEGESGAAIYYFHLKENTVEEKAFLPGSGPRAVIEKELGKPAYYNDEKNVLYVMSGDTLYKVDLESDEISVLLSGLHAGAYVSSDDGHLLAYQNPGDAAEAIVMDFATDLKQSVRVLDGEVIKPLGFIQNDFVYGTARIEDAGKTASGEETLGMYKLEIRDSDGAIVKTYQADGTYILDTSFKANMITLKCGVKSDGVYRQSGEDYITNNEEKTSNVSLQSYWSDRKETQMRLVFGDGMEHKKAKVLRPGQVLFERDTTLTFEEQTKGNYYSAFGLGELVGVYEEAGEALEAAKAVFGVVISPKQNYVWEDGNRVSWYRNFEMGAFRAGAGESTLAACIRAVLKYAGTDVDAASELTTKSALEVLNEYCGGEAVQLEGCSSADMRYLIDKGTPVIAMTGSSDAIVLIGYDAKTVTYIEPNSGGIRSGSIETVDALTDGSGNTFLGYVKK